MFLSTNGCLSVNHIVAWVVRTLSSVVRTLSSVVRILSSVVRTLSSVVRILSSVVRTLSSVLRTLSFNIAELSFEASLLVEATVVHTSQITPLNPPLERGETRKSSSLPFPRGGLGWGNSRTDSDSITCVYTVAW